MNDQVPNVGQTLGRDPAVNDAQFLQQVREANQQRVQEEQQPTEAAPPMPPVTPQVASAEPQEAPPQEQDVDVPDSDESFDVDPLKTQERELKPPRKTKDQNIRELRNSLKTEKERLTAFEQENIELKQQIKGIEELHTQVRQRDERIAELEKYEQMFALYQTPEYKKAYVDSIQTLRGQAETLAKEYGVDVSVVEQAVKITNRKELNRLLQQHFGDDIGVSDIRPIITEIQSIQAEREKADANPKQAREELLALVSEHEQTVQQQTQEAMKGTVNGAWQATLSMYASPDRGLKPLQQVTGNDEHNRRRDALLNNASRSYGQIVGALVKHGLRKLPGDLAKSLAAHVQLAGVSAALLQENEALSAEAVELRKQLRSMNSYSRPLTNGRSAGHVVDPQKPAPTGTDIAHHTMAAAIQRLNEK